MTPRLSVVMPTFNRAGWLMEALDSVLAPGLDLELLVLDNGSTDGTWESLQARADADSRIRPVRWDVNWPGESYPALLEMARGEYVNFFADDDQMLPGGLARKMEVLDRDPGVGMVFSTVRCMDSTGRDTGEGAWTVISPEDFTDRRDLFDVLIQGNFVPMPAAMFRRALAPTGEILRDYAFSPSHDWQFWLDLCRRTGVAYLREPTVRLRMHEGQVTLTHGVKQGMFIKVNLNTWRYWMLQADPPFIPSAAAWNAMIRLMAGALQATHGQDQERIQGGLRALQELREEQDAKLGRVLDAQETVFPEAFLLEPDPEDGAWRGLLEAYLDTFGEGDPALLALVVAPDAADVREAVAQALARRGPGAPAVRVLERDELLKALRPYPHHQWVPGVRCPLEVAEGGKGRRFAARLQAAAGEVRS